MAGPGSVSIEIEGGGGVFEALGMSVQGREGG